MPSSITLTVSHLPTSTSFFLSALQPLNYAYRGRSGQSVGFGVTSPQSSPPDFWLTQEIPGVPAGAAHVAFPASSRTAVQDFFTAALKAGGKIHGEPCVRDASGYYSAAVIDFDGNSIEAVYRPGFGDGNKENEAQSVISQKALTKAPSTVTRAPSVPKSTASKARSCAPSQVPTAVSQKSQSPPKGDVLDSILNEARSAANVARDLVDQVRPHLNSTHSTPAPRSQQDSGATGDAVVGTLLGVAAGAALTYAFTTRKNSGDADSHGRSGRPSVNGRHVTDPQLYSYTIEEAPSSYSRSGVGGRYITMQDNDYASTIRPTNRRRGSLDSGFATGSQSPGSRASHRSPVKAIEAPPSSYRAPAASAVGSQTSKHSHSKAPSVSRTHSERSHTSSRRSSHKSHRDENDYSSSRTVLHMTDGVRRVSTFPQGPAPSSSRRDSRSSKASRHLEDVQLPLSRAATWSGRSEASSYATARSGTTVTKKNLDKLHGSKTGKSDLTKSVIGKVKEVEKLDLPRGELTPNDSVSQISSVRPSSTRRSRRG